MKLVEEPYHWVKDNYKCRCWSRLQSFLRTQYAPHLLYADCIERNVEQEPKPESWSITDICIELRKVLERLVASQTAKFDTDPKSLVLVESVIVDNPEPEVDESEPEVVDEPESAINCWWARTRVRNCCWVDVTAKRVFLTAHRNWRASYRLLWNFQ